MEDFMAQEQGQQTRTEELTILSGLDSFVTNELNSVSTANISSFINTETLDQHELIENGEKVMEDLVQQSFQFFLFLKEAALTPIDQQRLKQIQQVKDSYLTTFRQLADIIKNLSKFNIDLTLSINVKSNDDNELLDSSLVQQRDELLEQVTAQNRKIKQLIDELRNLQQDIKTMNVLKIKK